ncbi:uncharacterized protein LOC130941222 [Arachis stenosperma]|uniref:uncharacterized protein LOC130941222 n=1 Tax=Arachis stenosperma TaxID=217475 RepID=UPI0025ABF04C|nr:uncharacterized protein LOC130941222 [Arachis stenosperma]
MEQGIIRSVHSSRIATSHHSTSELKLTAKPFSPFSLSVAISLRALSVAAPRRGFVAASLLLAVGSLPLLPSSPCVVSASPLLFVSASPPLAGVVSASLPHIVSRRRCFSSRGVSSLCYNPLRSQVSSSLLQAFNPLRIVLGLITGRHRMEKGLSSITTSSSKEGLPLTPHSNFKTASTDDDLAHILFNIKSSKTSAVINYGASWCRVCSEILPAFHRLSNNFPKLSFVYADIDECPETTQHIRYTPTFQFFRDGEKVDEMYGAGEERLRDRVWLHS